MKNFMIGIFITGLLLVGCGGKGATPALRPSLDSVSSIIPDTAIVVGIRLDAQSFTDPRYGFVLGYFKGTTSHKSQVIGVPMGSRVKFTNVDGNDAHTLSFLGNATAHSAPWPALFNGSATKSPPGTAIGTTGFSTGTLNPGKTSAIYTTGLPGFYMVGCAFHYDSNMMRTVIIVR